MQSQIMIIYDKSNSPDNQSLALVGTDALARSRRTRRSAFPDGLVGIASISSTPPFRCLYADL